MSVRAAGTYPFPGQNCWAPLRRDRHVGMEVGVTLFSVLTTGLHCGHKFTDLDNIGDQGLFPIMATGLHCGCLTARLHILQASRSSRS